MMVKCKFVDVGRSKKSWTDNIKTHDGMLFDSDLIKSIRKNSALVSSGITFNRRFARSVEEPVAWDILVGLFRIVGRIEFVEVVQEPCS